MSKLKQVDPHPLFSGKDSEDVALIKYSPKELSAKYGLVFERGVDDFDEYQLCAIELSSGLQAWLVRYKDYPTSDTTISMDYAVAHNGVAEVEAVVEEVKLLLNLTDKDISWCVLDKIDLDSWIRGHDWHMENNGDGAGNGNI
jgi:hypothetical protein